MIKKYKIFKESLLDKLNGPTEEELFNNIKNNPEKLFDMGVELNKKEWIILSFKKDKEQNYKNSGFCSFNDIADFFEKYKLSDDEKIEILDLLKTATFMLKVSIKSDFVKGIIYSIKRGADVNKISPNLYIGVVRRNNIDVLRTLIENGLNDEIISILKKEAEDSNIYELKNYFSNYIKTYESLLNKLEGPSKDEILDNIIKSNNPFDSLLKCISLDYQEGIDFIIKSFPDDSKIQGLKDWYNGYIKRWFSEKMDLTEVVDNNHIIKPTEDDNGNDLYYKLDDNLYYVNKYTGEVYLEVCFDDGEENYYYDYDIFYPKISNDSRLYWKHSENVIQGLTKYYFNEIPSHSSFSVLKYLEYKE